MIIFAKFLFSFDGSQLTLPLTKNLHLPLFFVGAGYSAGGFKNCSETYCPFGRGGGSGGVWPIVQPLHASGNLCCSIGGCMYLHARVNVKLNTTYRIAGNFCG